MKEKKGADATTVTQDYISENDTDNGLVRIHENVVVSIVREATLSVDGVVRLAGNSLVNNIAEIVGSRKMTDRSIKVNLDGPEVDIQVEIDIAYGSHIPTVASGVQAKIMEDVQNVTGMTVKKVDVIIQELAHYPSETTTEEAE